MTMLETGQRPRDMTPSKRLISSASELRDITAQARRPLMASERDMDSTRWNYRSGGLLFSMHRADHGTHSAMQLHDGLMYALSEEGMRVSYGRNGSSSAMEDAGAVVIPKGVEYEIDHSAPLYTAKVSARGWDGIRKPVGYSPANIGKHLQDGKAYKFVVPMHVNGEVLANGGEFVEKHHDKHIVLGPSNQEFSAGNSLSPQNFHVHMKTIEIFVTFSGLDVYYFAGGNLEKMSVPQGSVLIIPEGIPHFTVMKDERPNFVIKGSSEPIINDNFSLSHDAMERAGFSDEPLGELLRAA
ncbi:MAG: hypothetical protein KGH69_00340 [Candidatus Micrarchaeota archaeon]|nr:hypothetical protein [Candidatus Micrarchaeota archaeon]